MDLRGSTSPGGEWEGEAGIEMGKEEMEKEARGTNGGDEKGQEWRGGRRGEEIALLKTFRRPMVTALDVNVFCVI